MLANHLCYSIIRQTFHYRSTHSVEGQQSIWRGCSLARPKKKKNFPNRKITRLSQYRTKEHQKTKKKIRRGNVGIEPNAGVEPATFWCPGTLGNVRVKRSTDWASRAFSDMIDGRKVLIWLDLAVLNSRDWWKGGASNPQTASLPFC